MLPILTTYADWTFWTLFPISVGWALWRGGEPERAGAMIMLYLFLLQATGYAIRQPQYLDVDEISLLVDLVAVIGFTSIALNANRIWPIFASALQLLSLAFHFSRSVAPEVVGFAYGLMKSGPTGFVLVCLLVGTIFHHRRFKWYGKYRQWSCFHVGPVRLASGQLLVSQQQQDLAAALARGFLERPIIMCGALVGLYAGSATIFVVEDQGELMAAGVLLAISLATIVFGIWWKYREDRLVVERLKAFNERWKTLYGRRSDRTASPHQISF